ncbi:MAG: cation-translocating P-type ATPase [Actinobacteria bacterium]|nr:cation-translocating P-type ATPase [Actinomycetota bacterium]
MAGQRATPWALTTDDVLATFGSAPGGLTQAEAAARLQLYGPNEIAAAGRVPPWRILLDQFRNVLIIILLVATVISVALGEGVESVVILVIVVFAVLLGFVQEYRAERAIDALRELAAPTATAVREGREVEVPAQDLVPGDVIVLETGDRVPADARVLRSVNLKVDEAALTGESEAVRKSTAPLEDDVLAIGDRVNMVHAATAVTYGRGLAVVVATGMGTEVGTIATLLETVETGRTPLQQNLDRVGTVLARAAIVLVLLVAGLGLLRGQDLVDMLLFGIALAVAVVPEALPAVVTISLAIGVQKMVKRNALLRRLPAVETLGSTSVICSDKTGTLTKDEMTVRRLHVGGEVVEVSGSGYDPSGAFHGGNAAIIAHLLTSAALASDARLVERDGVWDIEGDPTEGAIVVAAAKAGLRKDDLDRAQPRIDEIPFTSETKRMTTLHDVDGEVRAYTKGAPEVVLPRCTRVLTTDGVVPLDDDVRDSVLAVTHDFASDALRVLAVAVRIDPGPGTAQDELTLLGLVGMIDPPRPEAREAIATCESAGIRAVMITGDHPATAAAVARELGLLTGGRVVLGSELDEMGDEELHRDVETITVYARVSPAHKLRVVTALQAGGHVVAMTGDGVNDAPALKKADIGVAMGITGTDVTKEAAAMTLTDDNFASIVAAIEEGRGVFANVKKYLMYLLSANIGEIGLMMAAMLIGLPLPLSAVLILYVNLATDGLPALALAVDPPEPDLMRRAPRDPRIGVFTRPVVALMLTGGAWSALINTSLFGWALASGRPLEQAMTMVFASLVAVEFLKAYSLRSDRTPGWVRPFVNKWLNLAILWESALLLAIIHVPVLQGAFGTVTLDPVDWVIIAGVAVTIVPVLELVKWFNRRSARVPQGR